MPSERCRFGMNSLARAAPWAYGRPSGCSECSDAVSSHKAAKGVDIGRIRLRFFAQSRKGRRHDSGNLSWLVEASGRRLFVKTAGPTGSPPPGAPGPTLDHAARIKLLRNAIDLASSCNHPALPRLLHVIESPAGPALVYEGVAGELVGVPRWQRRDPASAYQRFARLPACQPARMDRPASVASFVDGWCTARS